MRTLALIAIVASLIAVPASARSTLSDNQIRDLIIADSIADYRANTGGNCPCPYNRARNGSKCGKRSAYDREGGEAPMCFPRDVTQERVDQYRAAHSE